MKQFFNRLLRLILGLLLYALGIVVTINAHIGYAPWDVLNVGFAKTTGMTIGVASIVIGIIITIAAVLLGETLGLGTILNMVLIGVFLDVILGLNIIPIADSFLFGILMMIVGLFIISLATYFYISSAFGAGPRDSFMVAVTRKTGLPIGVCRGAIELLAVLVGWWLGGMVGIGTIISAFATGFCIQLTFSLLKFDATAVEHETLNQTYRLLFGDKKKQLHEEEI